MRMPTGAIPDDAKTMPHPDDVKTAILEPVKVYLAAHPEVQTRHRCPRCSALYPNGSVLCEVDGTELLASPELQSIVRRMTNDIGIFVRRFGRVLIGPPVEIPWDEWQFDIRPWLAHVHGIEIGKDGLAQTPSVNTCLPGEEP